MAAPPGGNADGTIGSAVNPIEQSVPPLRYPLVECIVQIRMDRDDEPFAGQPGDEETQDDADADLGPADNCFLATGNRHQPTDRSRQTADQAVWLLGEVRQSHVNGDGEFLFFGQSPNYCQPGSAG